MKTDYTVIFPESIWNRTLERMLASKDPILEMTAKAIVAQMATEKTIKKILNK